VARRVVWTQLARSDLGVTADYISMDSPRYAAAFVREVRDAARSLRRFAERGRVVPEFDDPRLRELIVRSYRLIYYVDPKTVHVIAFVHGARDLESLWRREQRSHPGELN
jgi:toxin ParE1/3/4